MFNPIIASHEIKESYIDYITTTFDIADSEYKARLGEALKKDGAVAKGPYIDIGGTFETGCSLSELIGSGEVSKNFAELEPVEEKERELKLERPLYCHQEEALKKASGGENLVITTGTGSGKTECFLLPIINHLLNEKDEGTLNSGVRAIIIYPMNALANDQMKRMRAIFKNYPQITYGVYNGNTEHSQSKALSEYRRTYKDAAGNALNPASNEIISREVMQNTPPNILITNYSMLEYMMLRPKDDAVFSGAKLKYIVLDEAHIYKGATGIETSLLMRRLRARISEPNHVQYILTSATLGGPDSDDEILHFANELCGVEFKKSGIIRSKNKNPEMKGQMDFPPELFEELYENQKSTAEILKKYHADFAESGDDGEKLYELFLRSRLFGALRKLADEPVTVNNLRMNLSGICQLAENQIVAFIAVCARAEKNGVCLIKPRYHFFVRALEGAYITLKSPKQLFLQRKTETSMLNNQPTEKVFEAAVCTHCGRMAVTGKERSRFLKPNARKGGTDDSDYFCLKNNEEAEISQNANEKDIDFEDYVICTVCGKVSPEADVKLDANSKNKHFCEHDSSNWIKAWKVKKKDSGNAKCPTCGFGTFRRFYLGSEAATSVLGTELFEQLPSEEVIVTESSPSQPRKSIFAKASGEHKQIKKLMRQFLCFSDSRSEAAFFASYMERSYQEFLRRRGIWHIADKYRSQKIGTVSVTDFVNDLARYFEGCGSFADWDDISKRQAGTISGKCREQAWIAVLNEMANARRSTSLVSMGIIAFEFSKNDGAVDGFKGAYGLPEKDARALLELLTQDAVFSGAINAGKEHSLNEADREYIFFTPTQKKLTLLRTAEDSKHSWLTGWRGRKRPNGNYYPNSRIARLVRTLGISEDDADELLEGYWYDVFEAEEDEFVLDANDFRIKIGGTPDVSFYRCKKCGRVTPYNVKGQCSYVKCSGTLEPFDQVKNSKENHYAKLYQSEQMQPLFIKEHTAQLSKDQQTRYQEAFVQKKINALSCSTTFEMGVDVGSLETVYMRDVPPSPANYVQRAGRAGRSKLSAAYVLTYAKLSSHDFTYYQNPEAMISGKIKAPVFEIKNEKILNRHIFAVALSSFFSIHEEVYAGDDQTVLLNEGGYEILKEYLAEKPESLRQLLMRSIPENMHERLGIPDFGWVEKLCGEDGVLEIAVQDFRGTIAEMEKAIKKCRKEHDDIEALKYSVNLQRFRCGKDDKSGKKSLISFLVRNNVLPKYGFPVDTVELIPNINEIGRSKSLQLARDLQMAIAEYAPGAQVIADGKMYTSRYIRKIPKTTGGAWETGFYCGGCPTCGQPNFTKDKVMANGKECVSCHKIIERRSWRNTLEPRMGFCAESRTKDVPMHRPERDYKTDDYYIGDTHKNIIDKSTFIVNENRLQLESTSNDSLVVVGRTPYYVCPICGYAAERKEFKESHETSRGYTCPNKEGKRKEYFLSHDFKTDVVKITFETTEAKNPSTMLSVLYAILEGLSRELGIERTDIKGCLFNTEASGIIVYSLILYDAVAGGAGHVRRIVTKDGSVFQRVIRRALQVADGCSCDSSCYQCLRNYYNQKIHDELNRKAASGFLHQWLGQM